MIDIKVSGIEWQEDDFWQKGDCPRGGAKPHTGWLKLTRVCKRLHVNINVFKRYADECTDISHGIPPFLLEDLVAYVRRRKKEDWSRIERRRNYGQEVHEGFLSVRQIVARSGISRDAVEQRIRRRGIKPAFIKSVPYYREEDYDRILEQLPPGWSVKGDPRRKKATDVKKKQVPYYHVSVLKDGYWYVKASGTLQEMTAEKAWYEAMGAAAEVRPNRKRI